MIEQDFDVAFIAGLAHREKQIQQNYRPVIAVHKWFARRPGTLFRALLLSEFATSPLSESFYRSHDFRGKVVVDPFMGGGTPLLEANRTGCDIIGYDINPMAYWIVREEIEHIDLRAYREAVCRVRQELEARIGHLYKTRCLLCGSTQVPVKYFLWVKFQSCPRCNSDVDLFPGYLLAENRRHPKNVVICARCGALNEVESLGNPGACSTCEAPLLLDGPAKKNRCSCSCGATLKYPETTLGAPRHRLFAIEYYCTHCRSSHKGRFFKKPDQADVAKTIEAEETRAALQSDFIPHDEIPRGDETDRLHRWGYKRYSEMFNTRQLLGLHHSCELIGQEPGHRIRRGLATNLSDLVRYQNMLCRYDTMALKSLDIFSVHGYPVGLIQCESNLLGIPNGKTETSVGSGGWSNIAEKYARAKAYCDRPFEVRHTAGRKAAVYISGEWIGEGKTGAPDSTDRNVDLRCEDGASVELAEGIADAVLTDPPYFGNVQYAELMDFCYAWLRRLMSDELTFKNASTRRDAELTANVSMNRGQEHFAEGLSAVFQKMARALKPGAPLAFTFHHNNLEAYYPVAVAILDAGLTCSASLPCPAEMGASIHISGTDSSIIDTVFVCRTTGRTRKNLIAEDLQSIASLVQRDVLALESAGVRVGVGDIRCITRGHLIRLAVWYLRKGWNKTASTSDKLACVARKTCELPSVAGVGLHVRISTATISNWSKGSHSGNVIPA
ncbi:MAG: DNA methylase [Acidobacteriia bacterium]|nr:DNA methylase [Terriglobia bacterium]